MISGEFKRIELFLHAFREAGGATSGPLVPLGPGDDAAIIAPRGPLAVTTDALVEDVHFRRAWATWEQIGHKALAVNLSDLAAMGARPLAFTCAFALPPDIEDDSLIGLAGGMGRLASHHGAVLAGGNFSRAREVSITITAFGEVTGEGLRRHRARPGDVVILVGEVGVAAAELQRLESGGSLPDGSSALLTPHPQIAAALAAVPESVCGIDVSDGLIQDLGHVAAASNVAMRIRYELIPQTERFRGLTASATSEERAQLLLAGGEDYALVLIASPANGARLCRALAAVIIGDVVEGTGVTVSGAPGGTVLRGHDHFAG